MSLLEGASDREVIVEALRTSEYLARDEERVAAERLAKGRRIHGSHDHLCPSCRLEDHDRAEAARRAMRYGQLADRILAGGGDEAWVGSASSAT